MIAKVENLEIRGFERRKSQKTDNEYLIVRVEDEQGKQEELIDRDLDNEKFYKKGTMVDMLLTISFGKYTNVSVRKLTLKK